MITEEYRAAQRQINMERSRLLDLVSSGNCGHRFECMTLAAIRTVLAGYSNDDLATLLRSNSMDLQAVSVAATAESLARLLEGRK